MGIAWFEAAGKWLSMLAQVLVVALLAMLVQVDGRP